MANDMRKLWLARSFGSASNLLPCKDFTPIRSREWARLSFAGTRGLNPKA